MNRGTTLVEVLVYLALYAVIVGGAIASVYSIVASQTRNHASALVQEEGAFAIGKIDYALLDARAISAPTPNGDQLVIVSSPASITTFFAAHGRLYVQRGSDMAHALTAPDVAITDLSFVHTASENDGINPEQVDVSLTLIATSSDGTTFSRRFTDTRFLRN